MAFFFLKSDNKFNNDSKIGKMRKGFTLIELMVVISVIGILSGIILVGMQSAKISARDAVRKQDVQTVESALLMYWEKTGQFPTEVNFDGSIGSDNCGCPSAGGPTGCTDKDWCHTSGIWTGLITNKGVLGKLPVDPLNNTSYYYFYEPCCDQDCGNGNTCAGKGCCEYTIGASKLESTGTSYSHWGRWEN